jgi:hypothetical protein
LRTAAPVPKFRAKDETHAANSQFSPRQHPQSCHCVAERAPDRRDRSSSGCELFDQIQARVDAFVDEIAERSVALGGVVAGTAQSAAKSQLKPYPTDITAEKEHLAALADRLSQFGQLAREAIDAADEAGDKDTADLFTGVSKQIDKDLWFVEAHLY